jgi:hypothetical protein
MVPKTKFLLPSITLLFFLFFAGNTCCAQHTTRSGDIISENNIHEHKFEFRPKALLVQLRSEQSRIQYFETQNDQQNKEQVTKEDAKVRRVMINDFKDHFTFCPVYYFIDTNAKLIKEQKI